MGIIGPRLFTIMVLMALVATFMTTPLLQLLRLAPAPVSRTRGEGAPAAGSEGTNAPGELAALQPKAALE